jgi:hypothetical protein
MADTITQTTSGKLTKIKVKGDLGPHVFEVLYSVKLTNIEVGDKINIQASFNTTTPNSFNTLISRHVILATSPTSIKAVVNITPPVGENITKDIHHLVSFIGRWYVFTAAYNEIYVNVILRSASTKANGKQDLIVETGKGWLDVAVFKAG